mmetsp:Transcript_35510/g.63468  ORF Transcript_35510/g.63468 Transcript_35510/m.63468 type:complete len:169 (-) Transcript_35510:255-761(-)
MGCSESRNETRETRNEFASVVKAMQELYDKGFKEEDLMKILNKSAEPLFRASDLNNDGTLDSIEVWHLVRECFLVQQETLSRFVKDSGADGKTVRMVRNSYKPLLRDAHLVAQRMIKEMDGNADGLIQLEEFQNNWIRVCQQIILQQHVAPSKEAPRRPFSARQAFVL